MLTPKQIQSEILRLENLKLKLIKIKGAKAIDFFYDLTAQIDVLRQINLGRKTIYTDHIEKFISQNK